ncbi:bifunctional 5,10-methylenetetrahydrofolate dehydrogenase/5,10-methenyltetrahydrofolate cyclohydrolase [Candidatus Saccharibacteria bacterium]|nr:bifunctional 5,10-methylenetetrahydrofolate dehydrogenase/5,10-methenyltetrahydrofolate cyclohydrolase [Candidatus Saccharibacteria bacterium]
MTKVLDGRELAGFIKERQAHVVRGMRSRKIFPKLVIVRDSDNPVIVKYVNLKKQYGEDIGIEVVDKKIDAVSDSTSLAAAKKAIVAANNDVSVSGIIVQLPLTDTSYTDEIVNLIAPEKDVDGLNQTAGLKRKFESATATAINWLLAGHGIELASKRVALVGYGRLVGQPLKRIFDNSGISAEVFRHDSDLSKLSDFDVIISATGVPHLITSEMISGGTVVVDAGTASEDGVLVGDVDEAVRKRNDLSAITPKTGGVGPLTVGVLFEDVIQAAES